MTRYFDIYPTDDHEAATEVVNELVFTSKHVSSTAPSLAWLVVVGCLLLAAIVVVGLVARGRRRGTRDLTVAATTVSQPPARSATATPEDLWFHVKLLLLLNVGLLLILALHRYGDWLSSSDWLAQVSLLANWRAVATAAFLLLLLAQVPAAGALLALIVALSAVKIAAVSFVALTLADVLLLYALIDARQQTHFLALLTLNWALLIAGFNHWFGLFNYHPWSSS